MRRITRKILWISFHLGFSHSDELSQWLKVLQELEDAFDEKMVFTIYVTVLSK